MKYGVPGNVAELRKVSAKSTASEMGHWLESLGLGEYADAFAEHAVDFRVLGALTEDDLKELGLKLGHRRILQQAVAELDNGARAREGRSEEAERTDEAERRQLTVMFCDMVGSTALSQALEGDVDAALETLEKARALSLESSPAFTGPWILGIIALYAKDPERQRKLLLAMGAIEAVSGPA